MKFKSLIANNKFTLVVSLPVNSIDYAKAALKGGAQAIKVHCNVAHLASGNTFGSFSENKEFLQQLIELAGSTPVGLVPGGDQAYITEKERVELEKMGLSFFSTYVEHLPLFMMDSSVLSKMLAIHYDYSDMELKAISRSKVDIVEASIMQGDDYGKPMVYKDILRYRYIARRVCQPVLVPTQKAIKPDEVHHLYEAGCKAVMIGANVMGRDAKSCLKATSAFRDAIDRFC